MDNDTYDELKARAIVELEGLRGKGMDVDLLADYITSLNYKELSTDSSIDSDLIPCGAFD
jgi:hypothetical protein